MENNVTAWLITLLTRQSITMIQSYKAREKLAVFLCWMCYILCVSIFEIRKNTGMERIAFIFREKTFFSCLQGYHSNEHGGWCQILPFEDREVEYRCRQS